MLDFRTKLSYRCPQGRQNEIRDHYGVIQRFEYDRDRILNSAAIRCLQQKTQVFPLERNAVVRTRLTHSLEVQQVGRCITKDIFNRLTNTDRLEELGLSYLVSPIESIVEMACLMHDIGNPPFGHFGEAAINQWFVKRLGFENPCKYFILSLSGIDEPIEEMQDVLRKKIRHDLCHFDGNAQAIRLVHTLFKLNLTYAQVASILKYTRPAYWHTDLPSSFSYLTKKPGFYLSEESFITQLSQELDIKPFHRFPLTYIMEAADDMSYCLADLEDAVEKKILTVDQLYQHLLNAWGELKHGDLFEQTVNNAYKSYRNLKKNKHPPVGIDEFFALLRVNTTNKLVPHAAERFIENLEEIFNGSFNEALLEDKGSEYRLLNCFRTVSFDHVFNHESVENIELQGHRIITGLLDIYNALLEMPTADFIKLMQENSVKEYPIETRLFHKLPHKYCLAYEHALTPHLGTDHFAIWEFYYRCRLIQDYISGMTDHVAYDEYRKMTVSD